MALFAACGDDSQTPDAAASCIFRGTPEVVLGTGPEDGMGYLALADGQDATLVYGPQGGFHVWTNVRARNVCFGQLVVLRTATLLTNNQVFSRTGDQITLVPASDGRLAAEGWGEMPSSRPTFMCPNGTGVALPGQMVRIDVTITDIEGRTASDHRMVIPQCPTNAFNATCQNQCGPLGWPFDGGVEQDAE